jgi:predicted DNA-binding transcriptional regulator AlpA
MENHSETQNDYPALLSAKHLMQFSGLAKNKVYECLNREDAPVVVIGGRRYMIREKFIPWIEEYFGIKVVA